MAQNKPPPMKLYILSNTKASRTVSEEKTAGMGVSGGSTLVMESRLHSAVILKQPDDDDNDVAVEVENIIGQTNVYNTSDAL